MLPAHYKQELQSEEEVEQLILDSRNLQNQMFPSAENLDGYSQFSTKMEKKKKTWTK
jgi:hypothetical protein